MLGYTLKQFSAYSKAVVRQKQQQAHEFLVLTRAAQAEGKVYKKVEMALRNG